MYKAPFTNLKGKDKQKRGNITKKEYNFINIKQVFNQSKNYTVNLPH